MKILERAHEWIRDVTLESSTLTRYAYSLGQLVGYGIEHVEQVSPVAIRHYMVARRKAGAAPQTLNQDLAAVSSFVRWLHGLGEFPLDVLLELRQLYQECSPPPPPGFLSPPAFRELRAACQDVGEALDLLVAMDVHAGLRLAELRRLWHDELVLETERPYVIVRRNRDRENKRKRERTVPIARAFADELLGRGFDGRAEPVFPARVRRGEALSSPYVVTSTVQRWLWEAQAIAGQDVTWLTFRHTYASWHVQAGVSIAKVAAWLGNSVGVCQRHYAALVPGGDADVERGFATLATRPS